jgi:hypothetical protein
VIAEGDRVGDRLSPAEVVAPSRHEKLSQAGTSTSSSSSTTTSASRTVGIVSMARRSAPASTRASILGQWKSARAPRPGS